MKVDKWQFDVSDSLCGPVLVRIRKGTKGAWHRPPFVHNSVPEYVKQYLAISESNNKRLAFFKDFTTLHDMMLCVKDVVKWSKAIGVKGKPYSATGTVPIEVPSHIIEKRKREHRLKNSKTAIRNLKQLAMHMDIGPDEDEAVTRRVIAHRLYKDTSCGVGISFDDNGVSVAGYCEGTDAECTSMYLPYPFLPNEFERVVTLADEDGCELWNQTHGCDECDAGGAINPECESCWGEGEIK